MTHLQQAARVIDGARARSRSRGRGGVRGRATRHIEAQVVAGHELRAYLKGMYLGGKCSAVDVTSMAWIRPQLEQAGSTICASIRSTPATDMLHAR